MSQDPSPNLQPRDVYWQRVRRLTIVLLASWFLLTFGVIFFARELSAFTLFGWPFPFYMAAQGLTLMYLIIVALYLVRMRRLDRLLKNNTNNGR